MVIKEDDIEALVATDASTGCESCDNIGAVPATCVGMLIMSEIQDNLFLPVQPFQL